MKLQDCEEDCESIDCYYLRPGKYILYKVCGISEEGCRRSHRPDELEFGTERMPIHLFECPMDTMEKISDKCKASLETTMKWNNHGYIDWEEKE